MDFRVHKKSLEIISFPSFLYWFLILFIHNNHLKLYFYILSQFPAKYFHQLYLQQHIFLYHNKNTSNKQLDLKFLFLKKHQKRFLHCQIPFQKYVSLTLKIFCGYIFISNLKISLLFFRKTYIVSLCVPLTIFA